MKIGDLKIGDEVYSKGVFTPWVVVREANSYYYIAVFDGHNSKIRCTPKEIELGSDWHLTENDAIDAEIRNLKREIEFLEGIK